MTRTVITEDAELPSGFRSAGVRAGLKKRNHRDMAMLVSDDPAVVAGVFTTNQVQAATVKLGREIVKSGGYVRGLIMNSGNANACTGEPGMQDARQMAAWGAEALDVSASEMLVCSTGHIGMRLPMPVIQSGIEQLASSLKPGSAMEAAEGMMTTDTFAKCVRADVRVDGVPIRITGLAKGAGMIEPNMATMLSFLMTDANVEPEALQQCLSEAVQRSFNRITVDGDQSTNDTVLFLANGHAGPASPLSPKHPDWTVFQDAVRDITFRLAMMIVRDGEGAQKLITIQVKGARTDEEADVAARAVGNSLLVKTSWGGRFAIWGRIMDAIGYSACRIEEEKVDIDYDEVPAVRGGLDAGSAVETLSEVIGREAFTLAVDLHLGSSEAVIYTCEISREYIKINETE